MTLRRILHAVAVSVLMVLSCCPVTVSADPGDPLPPPDEDATQVGATAPESAAPPGAAIGWQQFGKSATLDLIGVDAEAVTGIPVSPGVSPTIVSGLVGSARNIDAGRIDVLDRQGRTLGVIPIPLDATTVPFTVDTSTARIVDDVQELRFVLRTFNPPADSCTPPPSVALTELTSTLTGTPPDPATIADFLPPYLDTVVLWVGPDPSPDQQQAALTLAAILTRLYRPIPVRIDVDTSPRTPGGGGGTRRVIVLREAPQPGISVENPATPGAVLVISGSGPELNQQVTFFVDRRLQLAQTSSITVSSAMDLLTRSSNRLTFEQLGINASTEFSGNATLYIGFDTPAFAVGPIEGAEIRLLARYTPTSGDSASVAVRSGSDILTARQLDESGVLEMTFQLPTRAIRSSIGLALELQYFPGDGGGDACAPINDRMSFALESQSSVTVTPGSPTRGGFAQLPGAFTPEFDVAVDRPDHIRFAVAAINLMGQRTDTLLRPRLTSLDEAARSATGLLTVSSGESLNEVGFTPPITLREGAVMSIDGAADTELGMAGPAGVVQTFVHGDRLVLAICPTGTGSMTERDFDYIRRLEGGWAGLSGDVVATGPAGDTVNLTVRPEDLLPRLESGDDGWKLSALATLAAGVAVAAVTARLLILRRRRNPMVDPAETR